MDAALEQQRQDEAQMESEYLALKPLDRLTPAACAHEAQPVRSVALAHRAWLASASNHQPGWGNPQRGTSPAANKKGEGYG